MVRRIIPLFIIPFVFACSSKTEVVNLEPQTAKDKVLVSPDTKKKIKQIVTDETKLPETKTKEIEKVVAEEKTRVKKKMEKKVKKILSPYREEKIKKETALLKEPVIPVKMPDTIIRILILPYVDDNQVFHSGEYIFVKVEEGKWVLGNYITRDINKGVKEYNPLVEVKE